MMGVCGSNDSKETPEITLTPQECKEERTNLQEFTPLLTDAICISVYDGDSIRVRAKIDLPGVGTTESFQFVIRLLGIDTPEMRGKDEYEKKCARIAKDFLAERILGKKVVLHISGRGKYGRLLARVYRNGDCMNDLLVEEQLAIIYMGGTKVQRDYKQLLLKLGQLEN